MRYHGPVHSLAQRVLYHIRRQELFHAGDRVGVAVSGGIDSVALLRLMIELRGELGIVLSVVHFNHKLRETESDADEQFVANLAREHGLEFHADNDDVAQHAADEHISVETAARELRYGFFHHLLGEEGHLDKIVTGHTLDDQAETVLMRMIRGAGLRGLGAIYPRIAVEDDEGEVCGEIIRPLLLTRRCELEQYLKDIGQAWREDSTNSDDAFTRNRVRQLVVPLLEKEFNPGIAENLAELAEIARGEEDYWENEIAGWMGTAVHWSVPEWARESSNHLVHIELPHIELPQRQSIQSSVDLALRSRINEASWLVMNAAVDRLWFLGEPIAVQRRLVKAIGEHAGVPLEFKHVEEILRFAADHGDGKELSLPLGWKIMGTANELVFLTPDLRESTELHDAELHDYEYPLPVPGRVAICETGTIIEVYLIPASYASRYNPEQLLDAESVPGPLRVRNWRPRDRYWPAHTKSPKKIKELLQERHVPQPERKLWPVVLSGDEIIWLRGFLPAAKLQAKTGQPAIMIAEKPLPERLPT